MSLLPVALIIPTYNMAGPLKIFLTSLVESHLAASCEQIIIVDDGCTDETQSVITVFKQNKEFGARVEILAFEKNQGRYQARLQGAHLAKSQKLLFLDTRVEIPSNFLSLLGDTLMNYPVIQGTVHIPAQESLYNLYWDRSHRFIFRRHFQDQSRGFWLTAENYENYTSGTGIFCCDTSIFLKACSAFTVNPISDDRALIKEICLRQKIWVTEKMQVVWRPRQTLISFLGRLWERGPTFVAYHVYNPGSALRWGVFAGLMAIAANLALIVLIPAFWSFIIVIQLIVLSLSVVVFTSRPLEILRLAGLHLAVILVFGAAILWGLLKECPCFHRKDLA